MDWSDSTFRSPQFTFIVGDESTRVTVHIDVLRRLSPRLYEIATNGATEDDEPEVQGETELSDVGDETFLAFCEFAYYSTYKVPQMPVGTSYEMEKETIPDSSSDQESARQLVPNGPRLSEATKNGDFFSRPSDTSFAEAITQLIEGAHLPLESIKTDSDSLFVTKSEWLTVDLDESDSDGMVGIELGHALQVATIPILREIKDIPSPWNILLKRFNELSISGTRVFSGPNPDLFVHARLYVFARDYGVQDLQDMALATLHGDLMRYLMEGINLLHFLELLVYAYTEASPVRVPPGVNTLQTVVALFAAAHSEKLQNFQPDFDILVSQVPVVWRDLLDLIINAK